MTLKTFFESTSLKEQLKTHAKGINSTIQSSLRMVKETKKKAKELKPSQV